MPNWQSNTITASKKIIDYIMNGDKVDFNKLVPMPEDLNVTDGSIMNDAIIYYLSDRLRRENIPNLNKYLRFSSSIENCKKYVEDLNQEELNELYKQGRQYVFNQDNYGFKTWYDWRLCYWGTKWNACDSLRCGDIEVFFNTAWSFPEPLFKKLCELFPEENINFFGDNEDGTEYTGYNDHGSFICTIEDTWIEEGEENA